MTTADKKAADLGMSDLADFEPPSPPSRYSCPGVRAIPKEALETVERHSFHYQKLLFAVPWKKRQCARAAHGEIVLVTPLKKRTLQGALYKMSLLTLLGLF
jgi:hypothetical protein